MKQIVTFGEIMGRIATPDNIRIRQSRLMDVSYAGAEASVAASICNFGGTARFVTSLPNNSLGEAAIDAIRSIGVDTKYINKINKGRMGLYFLETGANQRPSNVIYDRENSSFSITSRDKYRWDEIFSDSQWLHLTGITPGLSELTASATIDVAEKAKLAGCNVSIDLNFRKKLWKWKENVSSRELAQEIMCKILPFTDLVIANEEDCSDILGIKAGHTDVEIASLEVDKYPEVAKEIIKQFPNIKKIAITLRESYSASHNNWGAMLYDASTKKSYYAPLSDDSIYKPYEIKNIVDRVGGGDAFAGGLIFALTTEELHQPQTALSYAVAASCLKHSIKGDFNYSNRDEVEKLMDGSVSGRVVR